MRLGKNKGKYILALAALVANTVVGHAQRHSDDSRMYFDYGEPMMSSVIQSADGRSADVRITTASSMFSFLRTRGNATAPYFAIRDITIEVDEQGTTQAVLTKNHVDTLYAKNFDETTAKDNWHAFNERITLPNLDAKKHYTMKIEVRDNVDRLMMHPILADLRPQDFTNTNGVNGIGISDIMLADSTDGLVAVTSAKGNSYMFSKDVQGSFSFKLADTLAGDPVVDVRVRQVTNLVDSKDTGERFSAVLPASALHNGSVYQVVRKNGVLHYALAPTNDARTWTALFTAPGQNFQQGKYQISVRVKAGGAERTQTNDFNIVWQNMPLSLLDAEDAIEPMEHIMNNADFKDITSGTKQEAMKKLYSYWQKQDPTPGTAYNERMATFYERVDYADFNFTNSRILNGSMTDRGKVYLLYGAPTNIQRTFLPGEAPTETWTYANNVNRVFRFEDHSHGEYRLMDIKDMAAKASDMGMRN
jgi:GWxTD domain-containing protein